MKTYSYTALDSKHQKLEGTIPATDELEARQKLHDMQLFELSLGERDLSDESEWGEEVMSEPEKNLKTFAFRVLDTEKKEANGTIDAPDRKTAFYRLATEFQFDVLSLCDASLPKEKWETEGKKEIEELAEEVEKSFGISLKKNAEKITKTTVQLPKKEIDSELLENVEEIIQNAQKILKTYKSKMNEEEYIHLQKKIHDLKRIRIGNNAHYLEDVSDEILTLLDDVLTKYSNTSETEGKSSPDNRDLEDLKKSEKHPLSQPPIIKREEPKIPSLIQKITNFFSISPESKEKTTTKEKLKTTEPVIETKTTPFTRFLEDLHLLFGWLLASYLGFLYFSSLVITKAGPTHSTYNFVTKVLSSPFPILGTGFFLLGFIGLTLCLRFTKNKTIPSAIILSGTAVVICTFFWLF